MIDNYARPIHSKDPTEWIFFDSANGLPAAVLNYPADWAVWDLRPFRWTMPVRRIGEDQDAREARIIGRRLYSPTRPGLGVPDGVQTPYRRDLPKQRYAAAQRDRDLTGKRG